MARLNGRTPQLIQFAWFACASSCSPVSIEHRVDLEDAWLKEKMKVKEKTKREASDADRCERVLQASVSVSVSVSRPI